ncbi:hypothetical protein AAMO2058_001646000 [Amorphochlora amoebiformis]
MDGERERVCVSRIDAESNGLKLDLHLRLNWCEQCQRDDRELEKEWDQAMPADGLQQVAILREEGDPITLPEGLVVEEKADLEVEVGRSDSNTLYKSWQDVILDLVIQSGKNEEKQTLVPENLNGHVSCMKEIKERRVLSTWAPPSAPSAFASDNPVSATVFGRRNRDIFKTSNEIY